MKNNSTPVDALAEIDAKIAKELADPELNRRFREKDGALDRARAAASQHAADATHLGAKVDAMEDMFARLPSIIEERNSSLDRIRLLSGGIDEVTALRLHQYDSATDDLKAWMKTAQGRIEAIKARCRLAKTKAQEAASAASSLETEVAAIRKEISAEKTPVAGHR